MSVPSQHTAPALHMKKLTAAVCDPRPRAIYCGVAGSFDMNNSDGSAEATVVVVAGSTIPLQVYEVTAINGATVIYGLYDEV